MSRFNGSLEFLEFHKLVDSHDVLKSLDKLLSRKHANVKFQ